MATEKIPGIDTDSVTAVPFLGQWQTGSRSVEVRSPYNDELIGSIPEMTTAEVNEAIAVAKRALHEQPLPQWKRAEILDKAAVALAARREQFAKAIAWEAAKPIKTARVEVDRAVSTLQFSAAVARTLSGEVVPLEASQVGEGKLAFTLRVPIGVIGAIAPFNFPLNLVAHKLGPAIAAGCPVVLKPATQTPFSSVLLAQVLIEEAGLPLDYLQIVTGGGVTVGGAIVDNPDVALITFTGSPEVGWSIRAKAPQKRVGLELGNNAPVIIDADGDWELAASKIKIAGFSHAGQSCISTQRIFVHESIAEPFTKALVKHVGELVVGDPLDDATDVSALISHKERDRVKAWVEEAVAEGGTVAAGGELTADGVLAPTIVTNATAEMNICANEVFGPVVAIRTFSAFDEALAEANDTRYGLQAGVFTRDVAKAIAAARTLDFGGVLINEVPTWRADQQPYGGLRDSGNTREGPAWSVREMTEERIIILNG